jgi:hypothetical protein
MSTSIVVKPIGPTMGLSVVGSSHAAATLTYTGTDTVNWLNIVNTSVTVAVAVKLSIAGTAAVLPGDGTVGDYLIPPMGNVTLPAPQGQIGSAVQVTAFGTAAGPTLIGVTAVAVL